MISSRRLVSWLLVLSWLPVGGVLAGPPPAADLAEDESVLQAAGVPTDSPGLLEYFRKQTLTAAEQERLQELIQRLGDRSFRVREQALLDLIQVGPPALPPLRQALQEDDPEIQRRAGQAITSIERQAGPSVVTAAVHLLEARRPAEASAVLLDYLPLADPAVEDEILAALSVLGVRQGRVDAALAAALNDPVPVRRAAAALVLGQSGNPQQRTAVRALLAETDPQVRFYAARGLIAGRDKSGLPALLPLLTDAPPELALQAEDLLAGLAGKEAPRVGLGEDAGSRRQCRAAWDRWWQTHEDQLDLERLHADAVMFDPALRVRQVGRQFLTALGQGDSAGLVRTMDFPFFLGEGNGEEMSREQFERFIQPLAAEMKQQKVHFTIQKVVSVEEYSRVAPLKEKRYLTTLTRLRLKVVYVEVQREGDRPESGVLFVRLTGGRARVVGIGDGEPRGGATR